MDPRSVPSKWESLRNDFANAARNGWGVLKLQALMRGTFIRENIVPTTLANVPNNILQSLKYEIMKSSSKKGNFSAILNLLASHDKELANHLENGQKNTIYTSKTVQNEVINIIRSYIRNQILKGLKGRGLYSIIADEVTGTFSNQEVLPLCVRFLDESQTELCIREEFFDFLHMKRTTGKTTAIKIVEVLTENNIPVDKKRGQAYDEAVAISSEKVGCRDRINSINQHALYTHCISHVLNLNIDYLL
ncbi:52 kDa repressor of the inhibitor of the protein kinase-like [Ylistrum balloti]|uniref:52 kDa repressor of the inhibitor of the protein kinase-like n=1 Tax=Ylistrum balloti TaxID=509963 RepID=UPI002905A3E2|nr:52 kDa repressor of the inhibitor of the protein kinase-like [Ylistrum balloti]